MAVEGQRDAKNAALIPGVRTLADSKLGVDLFRGSASLELYRGSSLQVLLKGCRKVSSIAYEKRRNTWLFIGLLNPNS